MLGDVDGEAGLLLSAGLASIPASWRRYLSRLKKAAG